jgi:hypothetical protein
MLPSTGHASEPRARVEMVPVPGLVAPPLLLHPLALELCHGAGEAGLVLLELPDPPFRLLFPLAERL